MKRLVTSTVESHAQDTLETLEIYIAASFSIKRHLGYVEVYSQTSQKGTIDCRIVDALLFHLTKFTHLPHGRLRQG